MTDGIHPAAFNRHAQVVHHLLAEQNLADSTGSYPLMWASRNGLEVVQMLLEELMSMLRVEIMVMPYAWTQDQS
jgi:ankyrin repeat protein